MQDAEKMRRSVSNTTPQTITPEYEFNRVFKRTVTHMD